MMLTWVAEVRSVIMSPPIISARALVMYDKGTEWLACYPTMNRTTEETEKMVQHFVGADEQTRTFYSDNAPELLEAVQALGWRHLTSLPYRPKTIGLVERQVKSAIEGGAGVVVASWVARQVVEQGLSMLLCVA